MDAILEKNVINNETEEDIKNIQKGMNDVQNNRVMPVDDAMKRMFNEREAWNSNGVRKTGLNVKKERNSIISFPANTVKITMVS